MEYVAFHKKQGAILSTLSNAKAGVNSTHHMELILVFKELVYKSKNGVKILGLK